MAGRRNKKSFLSNHPFLIIIKTAKGNQNLYNKTSYKLKINPTTKL